ncbi:hypothetical protein UE233_11395 [Acinetobacter oleivorans]|uniref:hypothetical protein n=1 Tax=Acinetobacter oleivorans TaxID=1148157 RepID=UPI002AAE2596|nr:hypothetical protein [Acinetobacter oleivorans]MDY7373236.1 hypothetical protein [Acinetobacter oleivorans]
MALFKVLDGPRDGDIHTLTDFAELLCLTDIDGESGIESVHDQIHDNLNIKTPEEKLYDLMAQIRWRKEAFGDFYPFNNINKTSFDLEEILSRKQKLYLALLFCANLPFINKSHHKILTDTFEIISAISLQEIWSPLGKVTAFGKNNTQYVGTKAERMNKLFLDLGNISNFQNSSFRPSDSGDGGIDLAAWLKLDDYQMSHYFAALAQCACSRTSWSSKHSEIRNDRFTSLSQISNRWSEILFTPICFRGNNGEWAVAAEVSSGILFDRLRIIKSLEMVNIPLPKIFDDLILEKRSLTS